MNQYAAIGLGALLLGGVGGFVIGSSNNDPEPGQVGNLGRAPAKHRDSSLSRGPDDRSPKLRDGTLGAILREPGKTSRMEALLDRYQGMDAQQLEEEADRLDGLSMRDRMMASMLLFSRWAEIDPTGAMTYANGMGWIGGFTKSTVLSSWASVDPVNAAKYYTENPGEFGGMRRGRGPRGSDGAEVVAAEWAKLDPDAALDWAKGLDGRSRDEAIVSVVGEMAATDPSAAIAAVEALDGDSQRRAYAEIAERWANTDFDAADAWVQTLSGDAKQSALGELISEQAGSDPAAAAERIAQLESGQSRDRAIRDVASEWSKENAAEAAGWLASQDSDDPADAMRRVMGNWVTQDAVAARAFIETQPVGELRDGATQTFIRMSDLEPTDAIELASSVSDERDRARMVGGAAYQWFQQEPTEARNFIESSELIPDGIKDRLLRDSE